MCAISAVEACTGGWRPRVLPRLPQHAILKYRRRIKGRPLHVLVRPAGSGLARPPGRLQLQPSTALPPLALFCRGQIRFFLFASAPVHGYLDHDQTSPLQALRLQALSLHSSSLADRHNPSALGRLFGPSCSSPGEPTAPLTGSKAGVYRLTQHELNAIADLVRWGRNHCRGSYRGAALVWRTSG